MRDGYWSIPAVSVLLSVLASFLVVRVDEGLQRGGSTWAFAGGPDSARSLLSTISTSMLSLTALVFSITIVVLQLASSQFSPRALPTFLRDRQNQVTLGVFLATYVYALLTLREVRDSDAPTGVFVPNLSIGLAVLLVLVSIGYFVAYIHHIATSVQVGRILQRIEQEARRSIGSEDAGGPPPPLLGPAAATIGSGQSGTYTGLRLKPVLRLAQEEDVVVNVLVRPGDFVAKSAPLLEIHGSCQTPEEKWLSYVDMVALRDDYSDVTLGLRQLLDIAERALSPGVNDPSTAVQCIDRIHDLLRRLAASGYPAPCHSDSDGRVRVVTPQVRWSDHVAMVLDELRLWGRDSLQVRQRLSVMVDDLLSVAPPARQEPLRSRLPLFREDLRIG